MGPWAGPACGPGEGTGCVGLGSAASSTGSMNSVVSAGIGVAVAEVVQMGMELPVPIVDALAAGHLEEVEVVDQGLQDRPVLDHILGALPV